MDLELGSWSEAFPTTTFAQNFLATPHPGRLRRRDGLGFVVLRLGFWNFGVYRVQGYGFREGLRESPISGKTQTAHFMQYIRLQVSALVQGLRWCRGSGLGVNDGAGSEPATP